PTRASLRPPGTTLRSCLLSRTTSTTSMSTLTLHDALPISSARPTHAAPEREGLAGPDQKPVQRPDGDGQVRHLVLLEPHLKVTKDRKSTRLNSSHVKISYAVFCLKKNTIRTATSAQSSRHA